MRKIYRSFTIVCVILISFWTISCSESNEGFLDDKTGDQQLSLEEIFADSISTMRYQLGGYHGLRRACFMSEYWLSSFYGGFEMATDECRSPYENEQLYTVYKFDDWTKFEGAKYSKLLEIWDNNYNTIANINIFLANIDNTPDRQISQGVKTRLKAEARFLRAFYYYNLMNLHGSVPNVGDKVYTAQDREPIPRQDFTDQVEYIISELDAIKDQLPAKYTGNDFGRVTNGAALALKARMLVYAASPLYNGGNVGDAATKEYVGYDSYDASRWERAKTALEDVIKLGRYSLVEDNVTKPGYGYYKMTLDRISDEYIFQLVRNENRWFESRFLVTSVGGNAFAQTFQGLIDTYPMKDGSKFDWNNSAHAAKPYDNRDPRFYYSILYHNSQWRANTAAGGLVSIDLSENSGNTGNGAGKSKTGYATRKFCNEASSGGNGANNMGGWPIIRYADIMLMYAEVLNEINPATHKAEIEKNLFAIRRRAGIEEGADGRYGIPVSYTQEDMRDMIRNERRIEFYVEGLRFFDVRRWKMGDTYFNSDLHGIKWNKGANTYEIIFVERHRFSQRAYFFPLPQREVDAVGMDMLPQNPGW